MLNGFGAWLGKAFAYLSLGQLDSVRAFVRDKLKSVDTTAAPGAIRALPGDGVGAAAGPLAEDRVAHGQGLRWGQGPLGLKIGHTYKLLGDTGRARMFGDTAQVVFEAQLICSSRCSPRRRPT